MTVEQTKFWDELGQAWICPGCGRPRDACERIARSGRRVRKLVVHHDHIEHFVNARWAAASGSRIQPPKVNRWLNTFHHFEPTVVCEECNNADARIKLLFSLPAHWSFSPAQLRASITPRPAQVHLIDEVKASSVVAALAALDARRLAQFEADLATLLKLLDKASLIVDEPELQHDNDPYERWQPRPREAWLDA